MAAKKSKITLRDALQGDLPEKGETELWSDLSELFKELKGS